MGFFSFVQEIAMDLGTANTIIISDDKIVVDEPSVVALDRRTDKMIAVGNEAKMMYEKTHATVICIIIGNHIMRIPGSYNWNLKFFYKL